MVYKTENSKITNSSTLLETPTRKPGRVGLLYKDRVEKMKRNLSVIKPGKEKRKVTIKKSEGLEKHFVNMPPLPIEARLDPNLSANACPWLEDYIDFSRKWSPRGYDYFHEACGVWLLATIAARRIQFHLGGKRYTNLYIALVARTSIYAKSTTASIAIQILKEIGLDHRLLPDNVTPERSISLMAEDIDIELGGIEISSPGGQRGWYYDEFGQHVSAMMRPSGVMSDFLPMLKRFDDGKDVYKYSTVKRGDETIEKPYLALLANMTSDCLRPYTRQGSSLWGDGFLARFSIICPPEGMTRSRAPFPKGKRRVPQSVSEPLIEWNKQLGKGDITIRMTKRVRSAYEAYNNALLDLIEISPNHDLDGNYAKLPEKGLRVAALLASVSGYEVIQLKHWARAQEICEHWRAGLHALYQQVNEPGLGEQRLLEDRILTLVERHKGFTSNTARQYFPNKPKEDMLTILDGLVEEGRLTVVKTRKGTRKYVFPRAKRRE